MKKNFKFLILLCLAVCMTMALGLTACGGGETDDIIGTYYCTQHNNEYISVDSIKSETSATVSVQNLTIASEGISAYTKGDISVNIYLTDQNDSNIKYFKTTINGVALQGTLNITTGTITIAEKTYQK